MQHDHLLTALRPDPGCLQHTATGDRGSSPLPFGQLTSKQTHHHERLQNWEGILNACYLQVYLKMRIGVARSCFTSAGACLGQTRQYRRKLLVTAACCSLVLLAHSSGYTLTSVQVNALHPASFNIRCSLCCPRCTISSVRQGHCRASIRNRIRQACKHCICVMANFQPIGNRLWHTHGCRQ